MTLGNRSYKPRHTHQPYMKGSEESINFFGVSILRVYFFKRDLGNEIRITKITKIRDVNGSALSANPQLKPKYKTT